MKLLYGSQNFGYDLPTSDKDWIEFVYPTWKNISICKEPKSKEYKSEDGSITKVKDIRLLYKMIYKANFNDLQVLFSKEMYDCEDLQWFIENRQRLIRANLSQLYKSNTGYIMSCYKSNTKKDNIRAIWCIRALARLITYDNFIFEDAFCRELREKLTDIESLHRFCDILINTTLKYYEGFYISQQVDCDILEQAQNEIERLLKKNLK